MNNDKVLTEEDANLILELILFGTVGGQTPSAGQLNAADTNGDGAITAQDAQEIFLRLLKPTGP
jgi:hypothetical protein